MKIWKRNAVVAAIVLFVCVAVYLNWSYGQGNVATLEEDTSRTLGEAALVESGGDETGLEFENDMSGEPAEDLTDAGEPDERTGYFDSARLSRQQARDEALNILQTTVNDPNAAPEAVSTASDSIAVMAQVTLAETHIEELIAAKGYTDCIAYIGDNSVSVVVSKNGEGLDATDVARITDIVLGETAVSADQVKIIEAE